MRYDDEPVRQTTHEWVRDRLRNAIFAGEFPPGSRLVQTDLADQYGVSVTPVREAMRDLINEGLVRFDPHKAASVRDLDVDEAVEINELRLTLEPLAVRKAAPIITDGQVDELERLQDEMEGDVDHAAWVELNHRWHLLVIEASRSPRLTEILRSLRGISRFYFAASIRSTGGNRTKSNDDHRRMIAAFRARDADAAGSIMDGHLADTAHLSSTLAGLSDAREPALSARE